MRKKLLIAILTFVMTLTSVTVLTGIAAFAAMPAPSVTAENTSCTSVKLSWKKISSAKKYIVYRSVKSSSGFKAIKTISSNSTVSYTNTKLTTGKKYYYKVSAVNGKNVKTSKTVSITVKPATIKSISAKCPECKKATVSYSKVSGASGYQIYASTNNKSFSLASTTTGVQKTFTVPAGNTRYYKVRAYKTVKSKKVYGSFSKVVKVTSVHSYGSYAVTTPSTCTTLGTKTATCKVCKAKKTAKLTKYAGHKYTVSTVAATCAEQGCTLHTCSVCGDSYKDNFVDALGHDYSESITEPTCAVAGYTEHICSVCGDAYEDNYTYTKSHNTDTTLSAYKYEDGVLLRYCYDCELYFPTDTMVVDLTTLTDCEIPEIANYSSEKHKLTLISQVIKKFELIGTVSDLTVSVDAIKDGEVKLNNVCITNSLETPADDCIRINDKCKDLKSDGSGEKVVPTISVSAKDGTQNILTVTAAGGNAIECESKLELKGHGTLKMDTVSTSITSESKVYIRNLTLDIRALNRGIDTKNDIKNANGLIISTEYANIGFGANATVTINTEDDCIRCKNMEFVKLSEGDVSSIVTCTSTNGDGLQLEGKTGLTMYSGEMTLKGGKSPLNNKKAPAPTVIAPAVLNKG